MKQIITNLFIILIVGIIAVGCGKKQQPMDLYDNIQQRGKIVVGIQENLAPFSYKNSDGQYQGFEVDIAKQIAKALLRDENAVEFIPVETANRISILNSGRADMIIATMTITKNRQNILDFTEPYYFAGQTVMVHRNTSIKSFSDLNGKRVGVAFGSTALDGIKTVAPGAIINGFRNEKGALLALKANEIDAYADDDTVLLGYTMNDVSVKMLQQRYTQEPYGIAFRKGEESKRVLETANNVITIMKNNGTLNQLKAKWIKNSN